MKPVSLFFGITAVAVFVQLLLGGLLTFNFINPGVHIIIGFAVFVLAIVTMILSLLTKPKIRSLQTTSIVVVLLFIIQIVLGFNTLDTGSQLVAWLHFVNAMAIYGAVTSGVFISTRLPKAPSLQK
jgi:heme A synthase